MKEESLIQKGFNAGYTMQQNHSDLAKKFEKSFANKQHPFSKGFIAGIKECNQELTKKKSNYLDRFKGKLVNKEKSKDKGSQKDHNMEL